MNTKLIKKGSLPGTFSLIGQALMVYKKNLKTLIAISLVASISSVSNIFAEITFKFSLILAVATVLLSFWGSVSMLYAIRDEKNGTNIRESLAKGWKKLFPYAWVLCLSIFIMLGGFFLFVIPGIIFLVWFYMSIFVLVGENVGGMNALLKSREYIRGYFWAVAGRLLFFWMIYIIGFWLFTYLFKLFHLPSYVSSIYSFIYGVLSAPFYLTYGFLLYRHLKSIKGEITLKPASKNKIFFIICGVVGAMITIILIIMFPLVSAIASQKSTTTQFNYKFENPIRKNVEEIQSALEKYPSDHGQYPPSLEDLLPKYLSSIPLVLGEKQEYYYVLQENGRKYMLCGDKFRAICVSP